MVEKEGWKVSIIHAGMKASLMAVSLWCLLLSQELSTLSTFQKGTVFQDRRCGLVFAVLFLWLLMGCGFTAWVLTVAPFSRTVMPVTAEILINWLIDWRNTLVGLNPGLEYLKHVFYQWEMVYYEPSKPNKTLKFEDFFQIIFSGLAYLPF